MTRSDSWISELGGFHKIGGGKEGDLDEGDASPETVANGASRANIRGNGGKKKETEKRITEASIDSGRRSNDLRQTARG